MSFLLLLSVSLGFLLLLSTASQGLPHTQLTNNAQTNFKPTLSEFRPKKFTPNYKALRSPRTTTVCSPACEEYYFEQPLDHFNFKVSTPSTFQQRYLVSDTHWDGKGPILFYTGNEGDIAYFWNNTGWVTETLPPLYNALVIFGEHRYYGLSLPFGNDSLTGSNTQYLTSEQALADYAYLLLFLKEKYNAQNSPVISFGGSYGGMLSSWFRIKYPHIVSGAVASSAPVLQFYGTGASEWDFYKIVTQDFASCSSGIRTAFDDLMTEASKPGGLRNLTTTFHICEAPRNVYYIYYWIQSGFAYEAMVDYPYPTDFLEPVPGNPCNVSCQQFNAEIAAGKGTLEALYAAVSVYYNWTGDVDCFDLSSQADDSLGTLAWDYQACTEMVMPTSANGTSDMFLPEYWDESSWEESCLAFYGVQTRSEWITTYYGGLLNPDGTTDIVGSNIVYLNGNLDPWSGGGVLRSISDSVVAIYMQGAAHHLDLRTPNDEDPIDVKEARETVMDHMDDWITEFHGINNHKGLGSVSMN